MDQAICGGCGAVGCHPSPVHAACCTCRHCGLLAGSSTVLGSDGVRRVEAEYLHANTVCPGEQTVPYWDLSCTDHDLTQDEARAVVQDAGHACLGPQPHVNVAHLHVVIGPDGAAGFRVMDDGDFDAHVPTPPQPAVTV